MFELCRVAKEVDEVNERSLGRAIKDSGVGHWPDEDLPRPPHPPPLCGHLCGKEVVYMVTAMDDSLTQLDRAMDALQGFVDCFDDMHVRARIYGGGATEKGDITATSAYTEAHEVGKSL